MQDGIDVMSADQRGALRPDGVEAPVTLVGAEPQDYGTGFDVIQSTVSCVITRFKMKSVWGLIGCYLHYRRIRKAAAADPGLLASIFAVGDRHICFTISLWSDDAAILRFSTRSHRHVSAGNWLAGRLATEDGVPELWSAKFGLTATSETNLRWRGVDVKRARPDETAVQR